MRRHVLSTLIALVAVVSFVSVPLAAQAPVAAKPAPAAKAWSMPRTPDGKPDLQGVYTNATSVPVARPAYLGAKEFYTDEADKAASAAQAPPPAGEDVEERRAPQLPRIPKATASPSTMTPASSAWAGPR